MGGSGVDAQAQTSRSGSVLASIAPYSATSCLPRSRRRPNKMGVVHLTHFAAFATSASKDAALGLVTVLRIRMSGGRRLLPPKNASFQGTLVLTTVPSRLRPPYTPFARVNEI